MKALRTPGRGGGSQENICTDPVEVYCRVKPLADDETEVCATVVDENTLQLFAPDNCKGNNKQTQNAFSYVFDTDTSQREVFDRACFKLVEDLIHGKNGLLFTYGITGSGKTFTMTGNPKETGILPRSLDVLFNSINELQTKPNVFRPDGNNGFDVLTEENAQQQSDVEQRAHKVSQTPNRKLTPADDWDLKPRTREPARVRKVEEDNCYGVFVSYVEIYNNYVYDLLDSTFDKGKLASRGLREDINRHMYVNDVTEVEVKNTDEAFKVFVKETSAINTSLMVLRNCMKQLRDNQNDNIGTRNLPLVPYRDSKLTHLFKKFFDGEGKVRMIVCLNPSAKDYDENLQVMQFAEMSQEIEIARGQEVNYDNEGLTPGRRRAALLNWPTQSTPISNGASRLTCMPEIQMQGPADEAIIVTLRTHFETQMKTRTEALDLAARKGNMFETSLRKLLASNEQSRRKFEEIEEDYDLARTENLRLTSENKRVQHQLNSVTQRLRKYESDAKSAENQEDDLRKKKQEAELKLRQKDAKLKQVKEALDRGRNLRSSQESNEGQRRGGITSANKYGGSIDALNVAKARKAAASSSRRIKVPPSPPPKPKMGNKHRRSKSVGGIVYESNAAAGFVMPKLRTRRPLHSRMGSDEVAKKRSSEESDDSNTKRQRF